MHREHTTQGEHLTATAWGEPVDIARHQPAVGIKGATYTELKVAKIESGEGLAQCIVDVWASMDLSRFSKVSDYELCVEPRGKMPLTTRDWRTR